MKSSFLAKIAEKRRKFNRVTGLQLARLKFCLVPWVSNILASSSVCTIILNAIITNYCLRIEQDKTGAVSQLPMKPSVQRYENNSYRVYTQVTHWFPSICEG